MNKTLAIIGSHPGTRDEFDWSRTDVDVWVFNEAFICDWCKRADAVFQMHAEVIWRNPLNTNDPKHAARLRSGNTPPVYMQEEYPDVPKSIRYPIEEATALLGGLPAYFTSSPAYALALGIVKGYKRIEMYGVEMATDTEYRYQRDGIALWLGVAVGRGIEVDVHSTTYFKSPLYGYTADITLTIQDYTKLLEAAQPALMLAEEAHRAAAAATDQALSDYVDGKGSEEAVQAAVSLLLERAGAYGRAAGVCSECERYIKKLRVMEAETGSPGVIVRQEHERTASSIIKTLGQLSIESNTTAGRMQVAFEELAKTTGAARREARARDFATLLNQHMRLSISGGQYAGALQQNQQWCAFLDEQVRAAGGVKAESALTGGAYA